MIHALIGRISGRETRVKDWGENTRRLAGGHVLNELVNPNVHWEHKREREGRVDTEREIEREAERDAEQHKAHRVRHQMRTIE